MLTAPINHEKLSITSPLNNKQETIATAKSDHNKRIKLNPKISFTFAESS